MQFWKFKKEKKPSDVELAQMQVTGQLNKHILDSNASLLKSRQLLSTHAQWYRSTSKDEFEQAIKEAEAEEKRIEEETMRKAEAEAERRRERAAKREAEEERIRKETERIWREAERKKIERRDENRRKSEAEKIAATSIIKEETAKREAKKEFSR